MWVQFRFKSVLFGLFLLANLAQACLAKESPENQKPWLRIETGMHTAMIRRIAIDRLERFMVTASDDKSARVWDLKTGELKQILRPPIGEGNEGMLYAVAISPDGSEVAVSGFTGKTGSLSHHIYFFDAASAKLTRQINALPSRIIHLAYSFDGQYLAAALWGANGIRIFETKSLKQVASDVAYGDSSYWVEFDASGRLLSTSDDGLIRLYDKQFNLIVKKNVPGGKYPFSARFSPDGQKIAVGFIDSTAVNVLDAKDLSLLYAPDTKNFNNGNLGRIAWSADGKVLYAGGRYVDGKGKVPLIKWSDAGRGAYQSIPVSTNTIMDIRSLSQNRLAYGTQDPSWGILAENNNKLIDIKPTIIDHRKTSPDKLKFSPDGLSLEFIDNENNPKFFSLTANTSTNDLKKPNTEGLNITDWRNNTVPKLNGKALSLRNYEMSRSLAISEDTQHFLLGTEWFLRYFDKQGIELWKTASPSVVRAVNISQDQRFAVAAFGDGTIRWYDLNTGIEQLAYFPSVDGKEWVVWTPEGFFNASPHGKDLIGYHLNQGENKEGLFVSVKQLYDLFFRPDLIAKKMQGDEAAIQLALAKIGDVNQVLNASSLPPELELISDAEIVQESLDYTLRFKLKDAGGGIGKLVYKVNGVVLEARSVDITRPGSQEMASKLSISTGKNNIEIIAYNAKNNIESKSIKLNVTANLPEQKASLYVLALGIKEYVDPKFRLRYADIDAIKMAKQLEAHGKGLFKSVQVKTLINKEASLTNIIAAFGELSQQVQPEDVFVLFMAGHGKNLDGSYHFIPYELIYKNDDVIHSGSLNQERLNELLPKIKAQKSVILLDTCDAGVFKLAALADKGVLIRGNNDAQETAIAHLMKTTGRAVLAATGVDNMAFESKEKHGIFTAALLEGLMQADSPPKDNLIGVKELDLYLAKRVPELSIKRVGLAQYPMSNLEELKQDFPIGLKP